MEIWTSACLLAHRWVYASYYCSFSLIFKIWICWCFFWKSVQWKFCIYGWRLYSIAIFIILVNRQRQPRSKCYKKHSLQGYMLTCILSNYLHISCVARYTLANKFIYGVFTWTINTRWRQTFINVVTAQVSFKTYQKRCYN